MFSQQATVGNNKPVCNYYLKGSCKYGTRCWNFHPPNQGGSSVGNTFLGGSSHVFGAKNTTQQDSKKEFQDFVKQVSGEMSQWERSGQWLVSSFSPLKGHPPFSGFSDTSPEEFRMKAYDAFKTNNSSGYQAHWNEMQQCFKQLREAVKMSTPEAIQAMREVFFTKNSTEAQPDQQQTLKQPSLFGKPPGQNIFGGTTQPNSGAGLLGDKPQSSVFGATPSVFGGGSQPSPNIFGGSASKPVFGSQPMLGGQNMGAFSNQSSNVFGGNSNVFKNGTQNTQTNTLFGGNQGQANTSSIFVGSNSGTAVQGQASSNIFGEQNKVTAGTSMFTSSTQDQTQVFGGSANFGTVQQSGLFGKSSIPHQQSGSVFGSSNVFGNNQTSTPTQAAPQSSVFGAASGTPAQSVFGGAAHNGGSIFSGGGGGFGTNIASGGGMFTSNTTSNVFAKAAANATGNTGTGLFGKAVNSTEPSLAPGKTSFFGGATQRNPTHGASGMVIKEHPEWYTLLDQLKPEEKAQFEAETFTSIPLCPPPIELCA